MARGGSRNAVKALRPRHVEGRRGVRQAEVGEDVRVRARTSVGAFDAVGTIRSGRAGSAVVPLVALGARKAGIARLARDPLVALGSSGALDYMRLLALY